MMRKSVKHLIAFFAVAAMVFSVSISTIPPSIAYQVDQWGTPGSEYPADWGNAWVRFVKEIDDGDFNESDVFEITMTLLSEPEPEPEFMFMSMGDMITDVVMDADTGTGADTDTDADTGADTDTNVDTDADTDTDTDTDTDVDTGAGADTDAGAGAGTDADTDSGADSSGGPDTPAIDDAPVPLAGMPLFDTVSRKVAARLDSGNGWVNYAEIPPGLYSVKETLGGASFLYFTVDSRASYFVDEWTLDVNSFNEDDCYMITITAHNGSGGGTTPPPEGHDRDPRPPHGHDPRPHRPPTDGDTDTDTDSDSDADADTDTDSDTDTDTDTPPPAPPGGTDPSVPPAPGSPGDSVVPGQTPGIYIEFDNDGVPLGEWHWDDDLGKWVFDEYPPLGAFDIPRTHGAAISLGTMIPLHLLFAFGMAYLAVYALPRVVRRRSSN